jgi:hypothetical protein
VPLRGRPPLSHPHYITADPLFRVHQWPRRGAEAPSTKYQISNRRTVHIRRLRGISVPQRNPELRSTLRFGQDDTTPLLRGEGGGVCNPRGTMIRCAMIHGASAASVFSTPPGLKLTFHPHTSGRTRPLPSLNSSLCTLHLLSVPPPFNHHLNHIPHSLRPPFFLLNSCPARMYIRVREKNEEGRRPTFLDHRGETFS